MYRVAHPPRKIFSQMTGYSRSEASVHEETHIHDRPEQHDTWISTHSEHVDAPSADNIHRRATR